MSWRDRLRPASFRGVPFEVEDRDLAGGRRRVTHEYPQRDESFTEDLGRKAELSSYQAFVVGADYDRARDRLIEALRKAGPGQLVDPWLGERAVQVDGWTLQESKESGGLAAFKIAFVEAGQQRFPAQTVDTAAGVGARADRLGAAAQGDFIKRFSTVGVSDFVAGTAIGQLRSLTGQLEDLRAAVGPGAIEAAVETAMTQALGLVAADAVALVADAPALAASVVGLIGQFGGMMMLASPASAADALRRLFVGYGLPSDPAFSAQPAAAQTWQRKQEAANTLAMVALVERAAVAEEARAVSSRGFENRAQALAIRDGLADRLEAAALAAGDAGDDEAYRALADLKAATILDIAARSEALPDLRTVRYGQALPSLTIANREYGDAGRAGEIAARNRVRHPGFVPPVDLQVLTA